MADGVQSGFLRTKPADNSLGPIVVVGAGGQALNGQTDAQARATPQPVANSAETGSVYNGTTALTPKFALLNVAASATDTALVAAVTSKKIRVLAAVFVAGGTATNLTFNSKPAGAGTAKTCLFANAANGGATLPFNQAGWFETVSGEGLSVTTGAGSTTGIQVVYVEV